MLSLATPETLWVNLTVREAALGIQLHWGPDVPLTLSLGFGYYPNETSYDAQTHLPPVAATGSQLPWLFLEGLPGWGQFQSKVSKKKIKEQGQGDGLVIKI